MKQTDVSHLDNTKDERFPAIFVTHSTHCQPQLDFLHLPTHLTLNLHAFFPVHVCISGIYSLYFPTCGVPQNQHKFDVRLFVLPLLPN